MTPDIDLTNPEFDPLANETRSKIGRIAVCGIGKLGKVRGRAFCTYGKWAWVGIGFDREPWSSTQPRWLDAAEDNAVNSQLFGDL